jgi:protein-tyrosine phosphatase
LAVVAHVERYPELARNIGQIEKMGRSAALLVNLSGLGGINGWRGKRLARRLVKAGLIHAVSTDIHSLLDIPFCIAGKEWIQSKLGNDVLDKLLVENPRRIIAGELPELYPE